MGCLTQKGIVMYTNQTEILDTIDSILSISSLEELFFTKPFSGFDPVKIAVLEKSNKLQTFVLTPLFDNLLMPIISNHQSSRGTLLTLLSIVECNIHNINSLSVDIQYNSKSKKIGHHHQIFNLLYNSFKKFNNHIGEMFEILLPLEQNPEKRILFILEYHQLPIEQRLELISNYLESNNNSISNDEFLKNLYFSLDKLNSPSKNVVFSLIKSESFLDDDTINNDLGLLYSSSLNGNIPVDKIEFLIKNIISLKTIPNWGIDKNIIKNSLGNFIGTTLATFVYKYFSIIPQELIIDIVVFNKQIPTFIKKIIFYEINNENLKKNIFDIVELNLQNTKRNSLSNRFFRKIKFEVLDIL
jgi:hypothetical protein